MIDTNSHINSDLSLSKSTIPIDENTIALFHYDVSANSYDGIIKPLGSYVDDSTVLYYDMADTFTNSSGTYIIDKSSNGNYGKVSNLTFSDGINGVALNFNGSSDKADVSYIESKLGLNGLTSYSIEAWVRLNNNGTQEIISRYLTPSIELYVSGSTVFFRGNGVSATPASATGFAYDTWQHIVAIVDASASKSILYLNGIKGTDGNLSFVHNFNNENIYIGSMVDYNSTLSCKGTIDKIVVLDRVIPNQEVLQRNKAAIYSLKQNGKYGAAISIENGSENLVKDANQMTTSGLTSVIRISPHEFEYNTTGGTSGLYFNSEMNVKANTVYTLSYKVTKISGTLINIRGHINTGVKCLSCKIDGVEYGTIASPIQIKDTYEEHVVEVVYNTGPNTNLYYNWIQVNFSNSVDCRVRVNDIQLEEKPFSTSFTNGSRENGKLIYENPIPNSSEFTISFWLNLKDIPTSNPTNEAILTLNDGADKNGVSIDYETNSTLRFFTYNSVGVAQVAVTRVDIRHKWTYITVVRDSTWLYGYVNGELMCQIANAGTVILNGLLEFGNRNTIPANTSNMLLDELRIDDVARTEKEILSWYVSDSPFYPRGVERIVE